MSTSETPKFRLGVLGVVMIVLFSALFGRLWYLQVLENDPFVLQAEANRTEVVQVEAPRGRILDRNGRVLVDNQVTTVVTVDRVGLEAMDGFDADPADVLVFVDNGAGPEENEGVADNGIQDGTELGIGGDAAEFVLRLAEEMSRYGSPVVGNELLARIMNPRYTRFTPIPVAEDVSDELKIYLDEHAEEFPGVVAARTSVRRYHYGTRAAHLLGYVGEINAEELETLADKPKTYVAGNQIGRQGVEKTYEDELRGQPGQVVYEVDAQRRPVRVLEDLSTPPIAGDDVWLSIDIDLQAYSEDLLEEALVAARNRPPTGENLPNEGTGGAVVVMSPKNGQVLAMASYPTYDPSDFINGISERRYAYLNDPANNFPLSNRAIAGQYAPGSTYKLITGYGAMIDGVRTPEEVYFDTGSHTLENCTGRCEFRNAGGVAYGSTDMTRAMTVSSDAYFYSIGEDFWDLRGDLGEEAMQDSARAFGLGQQTGIPLPGEASGRIPSPDQRRAQYEANPEAFLTGDWFTGDNVNMAIGQGDVAVTPLQLANAYATFANGGTVLAPNIARQVTAAGDEDEVTLEIQPREEGIVELPPRIRDPLYNGLIGVTAQGQGTASGVFSGFPLITYPVAAKTGTAQANGKADNALFAAFGPGPDPNRVVTVVLEESGFGGTAAAPVARKLFDVFAGLAPMPRVEEGGALVTEAVDGQPSLDQLAASGSQD